MSSTDAELCWAASMGTLPRLWGINAIMKNRG